MIPGSANPLLLGQTGTGGYEIERSLRFNSGDSARLTRTFSAGNRKVFTISLWAKKSQIGSTYEDLFGCDVGGQFRFIWEPNGNLEVYSRNGSTTTFHIDTVALFRDPSAWYHFVVSVDATNTSVKFYVNGVELTDFVVHTAVQNLETMVNSAALHTIGSKGVGQYLNAYLADVHFIDGQALAPTDFGETDNNGVWQPKKYAGQYNYPQSGGSSSAPTSTTDVAPSGSYGNGIASAALLFGSSELTNGQNHIRQDNGGIEWSPAIALTGSDVAGAKCLYFNNQSSSFNIEFKINGSWVTAQANAQTVIGTGSALITLATTGNWTGVRVTGGSNISVTTVAGIFVNGTRLQAAYSIPAVNGFHLDFADNSSNAALGTDTSGVSPANTWTVNNLNAQSTVSANLNWDGSWNPATPNGGVDKASISGNVATAISGRWSMASSSTSLATNAVTTSGFQSSSSGNTFFGLGKKLTGSYNETIRDSTISYGIYFGWNNSTNTPGSHGTSVSGITFGTSNVIKFEVDPANSTLKVYKDGSLQQTVTLSSSFVTEITNGNIYWQSDQYNTGTITLTNGINNASPDSLVDSPTNAAEPTDTGVGNEVVGNYATLNPLAKSSGVTLSNGNLDASVGSDPSKVLSTIGMSSGKYYAEFTVSSGSINPGLATSATNLGNGFLGNDSGGWCYGANGKKYHNDPGASGATYGATYTTGDVIGVAFDADNGSLTFYKNGATQGAAFTGLTSGPYFFAAGGSSSSYSTNFGQHAFAYPLSGYKSLNTASLPEPTIADGSKYFDTKVWTGTGSSQDIAGYDFSPDFAWIKSRSASDGHGLFDQLRLPSGSYGYPKLKSQSTDEEKIVGTWLTSFNNDGFTLNASDTNGSGKTFVGWAWDAGSSNTTIAAGGLNSSLYNQAQAWNSQVTGTSQSYDFGGGGLRGDNNWFDGDIKHASSALSGNTITWTGSIAFTSSFAIASDNDGADPSVSAPYNAVNITHGSSNTITNVRSQLPNTTNSQIAAGTIPLTVLTGITSPVTKIECVGGTQGANGLTQVVADGRMLVDSGITLANVPSIASTVRANPSAGFSIVSWTGNSTAGATLGHSLSAAPKMIIIKNRSRGTYGDWVIGHDAINGFQDGNQLYFTNAGVASGEGFFNNTSPTSSVFTVKNNYQVNYAGDNYVAYCFAPVEGYSAMGSYTGNGNAAVKPFIYLGFRPAFILIKASNISGKSWIICDYVRDGYNSNNADLSPDSVGSENNVVGAAYSLDIFSNGFQLISDNSRLNQSGATYIYYAVAENPFQANGGLAR